MPYTVWMVWQWTIVSQFISTSSLEEKVPNVWQMENDGLNSSDVPLSHEDQRVIELWDKECKLVEGHYEIPIPWRQWCTEGLQRPGANACIGAPPPRISISPGGKIDKQKKKSLRQEKEKKDPHREHRNA